MIEKCAGTVTRSLLFVLLTATSGAFGHGALVQRYECCKIEAYFNSDNKVTFLDPACSAVSCFVGYIWPTVQLANSLEKSQ